MHTVIVVTSNYTPEELWPDDPELLRAIRRRFKVEHILGRMCVAPGGSGEDKAQEQEQESGESEQQEITGAVVKKLKTEGTQSRLHL